MAGRGGRANTSINLQEALGISRGEVPPSAMEPPPWFPPLTAQPVPLHTGLDVGYMLDLKQELRAACKNLPFYIKAAAPRTDVEKYSDRHRPDEPRDSTGEWRPDWSRLPKELRIKVRTSRGKALVGPPRVKDLKKPIVENEEEVLSQLESREKKEEMENSADEDNEEHAEEEDLEDKEKLEEETDYIMSYFDNGEDSAADSMDEATY